MGLTTGVFFFILAFFTWRGYQKGFVGTATKLISLIVAYPAAIYFTKPFAHVLRGFTGLDGLILFLVAGCTIFAVVSLLVTLLLNALAKTLPSNSFTEVGSKIGGTLLGVIVGCVIGLIAVYLIGITRTQAPSAATTAAISAAPAKTITAAEAESIQKYVVPEDAPTNNSFIDLSAKKLVSNAASTAVGVFTSDDATSQLTKTLTADPQAMLGHVQNIANDKKFASLLSDPRFQAELNKGNTEALLKNKDFQSLMQNPDMRAIISAEANGNAAAEQAAAEKMITAWKKVENLKTNPRVMDIVTDPAFQAQLNSPNKLPLLMNPSMRELTEIIFNSDEVPAPPPKATQEDPSNMSSITRYEVEDITNGVKPMKEESTEKNADGSEPVPEKKLYRWTDKDGNLHYSDKPIKN